MYKSKTVWISNVDGTEHESEEAVAGYDAAQSEGTRVWIENHLKESGRFKSEVKLAGAIKSHTAFIASYESAKAAGDIDDSLVATADDEVPIPSADKPPSKATAGKGKGKGATTGKGKGKAKEDVPPEPESEEVESTEEQGSFVDELTAGDGEEAEVEETEGEAVGDAEGDDDWMNED